MIILDTICKDTNIWVLDGFYFYQHQNKLFWMFYNWRCFYLSHKQKYNHTFGCYIPRVGFLIMFQQKSNWLNTFDQSLIELSLVEEEFKFLTLSQLREGNFSQTSNSFYRNIRSIQKVQDCKQYHHQLQDRNDLILTYYRPLLPTYLSIVSNLVFPISNSPIQSHFNLRNILTHLI